MRSSSVDTVLFEELLFKDFIRDYANASANVSAQESKLNLYTIRFECFIQPLNQIWLYAVIGSVCSVDQLRVGTIMGYTLHYFWGMPQNDA